MKTARKASTSKHHIPMPQQAFCDARGPLPSTAEKCAARLRALTSEPLKQRLDYWHKGAALVTGAISMSYSGKGISRRVLREWYDLLRAVADDIEKTTLADQPKEKKK
jgi:hypothetical protein